jgi:hypothetical protein
MSYYGVFSKWYTPIWVSNILGIYEQPEEPIKSFQQDPNLITIDFLKLQD